MRQWIDLVENTTAPEIRWAVPRDSDEYYRTVWIDTDKLYQGWRGDAMFVGGSDHPNAIKGRIPRFDQWMQNDGKTTPVIMPDVSISLGNVAFGNGRHRFTWMREHGVKVMPIRVPVETADEMQERFGVSASEVGMLHDPRQR